MSSATPEEWLEVAEISPADSFLGSAPKTSSSATRVGRLAERVIDAIGNIAAVFSALLIAAELLLVFSNVIARYFFDSPYGGWADDLTIVLLIAIAFSGATIALARNQHPGVLVFLRKLRPGAAEIADALRAFLVLIFTVYVVAATWVELPVAESQASPNGIPLAFDYWPLLVAAAAMTIVALCKVLTLRLRPIVIAMAALVAIVAIWYLIYYYVLGTTFNPTFLMIGAFIVVMALGVPIGFSLGIAAMVYVATALPTLPFAFAAGRMVAGVNNFELLAVPFFVAAGVLMEAAGVFNYLLYLIRLLLGRVRGGLNIVTIVSLYAFSGISGSRTADIAAVGKMIMPEYRSQGQGAEGLALIAAGSGVGETVPPSTEILIIASLANLSVGTLFTAGILPAAVLALALIAVSVISKPVGFGREEARRSTREKLKALLHSVLALLLPVILVGGVSGGIGTPTEVSSFAVVYALLLGTLVYRNVGLKKLVQLTVQTATLSGIILFIFANATMIAWLVAVQAFPHELVSFVERASGDHGSWLFMILTIFIMLFMGWLMEGLPAIVILMPLLLPAAVTLGINPIQYVMVMTIAMDVGTTAPPFGLGLFTASAIGGISVEKMTPHIIRYLVVLVLGLLLIAFVPDITLILPRLLGLH